MMWARFRTSKIKKDAKEKTEINQTLNVNEEYFRAIRTKSFADFFIKANELLVNEGSPSPSSSQFHHHNFAEILLDPGQEQIATILESETLLKKSNLKTLLFDYFDISFEASKICTQLLKSISQLHSIQLENHSPSQISSDLNSFLIAKNPFSNLRSQDFKIIRDRYSSVLHHLKSKRIRVSRRIRLIDFFNKASGVCVTLACGLVTIAAVVVAAHTLVALVMGAAILGFPVNPVKNRITSFRFLKTRFLKKIGNQLDVAAKGTYILNRDFDTMGRLVARVHDEIEHKKEMIRFCLERKEGRLSMEVMKELRKSDLGFRKQVEELEEHVYLCLVTINRARALVVKEILTSSCVG